MKIMREGETKIGQQSARVPFGTRLPSGSDGGQLAAVDLGSNSFHLVIARVHGDEVAILDRVRDPVRLGKGLGKDKRVSRKTRERCLASLRRFRQRLRHVPASRIRAVGTNTLRQVRDGGALLTACEEALGHPIEVISGPEEGRLIYLGVAHSLADDPGRRLVVDIGGGSTECIIGERFEALHVHSLDIGCVKLTRRFFPKGTISKEAMREARLAAEQEFQSIERTFREAGWESAAGSSGTIRATETMLRLNGWSDNGITPTGLKKLRKAVTAVDNVRELRIKGLKPERASIYPGGLAVLLAAFDRLGVESMGASSGALREGVTYDLLGRIRHEDVRERTIRIFQDRYRVDSAQAARIERLALALLSHSPRAWHLDDAADGRFLVWAARLHEIGHAVAYSRYHRHGGYLIANADMPGFSRDDQRMLAALVSSHRRKPDRRALEALPDAVRERATRLVLILRLAVLLHRSRSPVEIPPLRLEQEDGAVALTVPEDWLAAHPLTRRDLEEECRSWDALGASLTLHAG